MSSETQQPVRLIDDVLGGGAAALVALPAAIAFGLLVYAGLGDEYATQGANYGMIGALALGIVAAVFGGRPGNISAPCAPAGAVLAALVGTLLAKGDYGPGQVVVLLGVVSLGAGLFQFLVGVLGGGKLIKFIPYPVIAGYLAAVGLLIVGSQLPKLVSLPAGTERWSGLSTPSLWNWKALLIGGVTMLVMLLAPKVTKKVPAPILSLTAGFLTYGALCIEFAELRVLGGNPLVIGRLGGGGGFSLSAFAERARGVGSLRLTDFMAAAVPALTLGVLLSIDTLKTAVLVDSLTRTRHDSDRELRAQGLGNGFAAILGGMPGGATTGPTLVNVSSGGRTRRSGIVAGVFSLLAFLALSDLISWVPVPALAGILIVIGCRMIDLHSFDLLKRPSTKLDFFVVAAVVTTALLVNLIVAAGVGLVLAIVLFLRAQIRSDVVRRWLSGSAVSSKKRRLPDQKDLLQREGDGIAVFELQGNLFFGTTDQLFSELEPHIAKGGVVILDLSRVDFLDFTASRMLRQIGSQIEENGGVLVMANLDEDLTPYLHHFGVIEPEGPSPVFPDAGEALGWAEDRILEREGMLDRPSAPALSLSESYLFKDLSPEHLAILGESVEEHLYAPGERIFSAGDPGDTLYLVRRGAVRIVLSLEGGGTKHLATFGRANFFGDMSFLSQRERSAHAEAETETEVFSLSREASIRLVSEHPEIGSAVFIRLGKALAGRLRNTNAEIRSLAEA
jgi:SulP family sulfate permease